jgi:hypothetical protein
VAPPDRYSATPAADTGKIPEAARVWLGWSTLRIDEVGIGRPAGNSVTKPAPTIPSP